MKLRIKQSLAALSVISAFGIGMVPGANAAEWDNLLRKPVVKQAAIGAAAGAAAGALTDRTSVGKGALTGAVVGVGTGYLTQSEFFRYKPLARNAAQGAIIGTGVGYATDSGKVKGALIGAGAGAGYHYVRKYLDRY